jgi:hypothetical protein
VGNAAPRGQNHRSPRRPLCKRFPYAERATDDTAFAADTPPSRRARPVTIPGGVIRGGGNLLRMVRSLVNGHRDDVRYWESGQYFARQPRFPIPAFDNEDLVVHRNQYRPQFLARTQCDRYGQTLFAELGQCRSKGVRRSALEANADGAHCRVLPAWST